MDLKAHLGIDIRSRPDHHPKPSFHTIVQEALVASPSFEIEGSVSRVVDSPMRIERNLEGRGFDTGVQVSYRS